MPKGRPSGKGKLPKVKAAVEVSSPLSSSAGVEALDMGKLTLQDFKVWTQQALQAFLSVRKKCPDGTFEELAAR